MLRHMGPRELEKRRERQRAIAAFVVALLVLGGMLLLFALRNQRKVDVNATTLCPPLEALNSYTALLVDTSDTYNSTQRLHISSLLSSIKQGIPTGGRLDLFGLGTTEEAPLLDLICRCNPGEGGDDLGLTDNPVLLRNLWVEQFDAPLDSLLRAAIQADASAKTPLMEAIQLIGIRAREIRDMASRYATWDLIIISDMLQNSSAQTHYRTTDLDFADFSKSSGYRKVRTDLLGANITVLYIRRDDNVASGIQQRGHVEFWDAHFSSCNGSMKRIVRVQG